MLLEQKRQAKQFEELKARCVVSWCPRISVDMRLCSGGSCWGEKRSGAEAGGNETPPRHDTTHRTHAVFSFPAARARAHRAGVHLQAGHQRRGRSSRAGARRRPRPHQVHGEAAGADIRG